jgi:polyhydroxybutyrate depolymerase
MKSLLFCTSLAFLCSCGVDSEPANGVPGGPSDPSQPGIGDAGGSAGADGQTGMAGDAGAGGSTDAGSGDEGHGERPGTGPGDWGPGDYPPALREQDYLEISGVSGQAGHTRHYKVHVPPSYDPATPTPLVFCIHGLSQNPVMFCVDGTGMPALSDQEGFILVMPLGYQNSWNGGTCCGGASSEGLDDVALFRAILDEVGSHVNVDLGRVYATGLSNGGFMSYRLACEASDVFAAVAPNAGAVGINTIGGGTNPASDFTECDPVQPVAVFHTHGTADLLVSHDLMAPSLDLFATANGCGSSTAPAQAPTSGGDTECVSYACEGTEVTGCTVEGGGHCWFGSDDCGTGGGLIGNLFVGANSNHLDNNPATWDFFTRHIR